MNLEEFLTSRMQEMSKFYNQLNIPIQNDIKFNVQVKEQKNDNRNQQFYEQKKEVLQNSFINEFIVEPQNQQNQYTNSFDEIPIKGAQKPFEQLFQDQGIVEHEKKDKKEFLKKGARQYLSNAQTRSELSKKEHQEILKMNNENATEQQQQQQKKLPINFLQKGKGKQCTQKVNDSLLDHSKNDESIIQQNEAKNDMKNEKQLLEQQQKELQKHKIQQQKQLEQEKLEFEKWKDDEKRKIERITKKHYTIQQQRQQQLTTKQLEELDFLRKRLAQQNEEIKELKSQLEKSQLQLQQISSNQNISTHNINKLIGQSSPVRNYSTKISNASENKTNSYAIIHNKQGCINEEDEFDSQIQEDQNSYQNGDSYEQEKIKIDIIQLKNHPNISIDIINDQIDESEFEFQNNKFYSEYLDYLEHNDDKIIQQYQSDGKISRTYQSEKKEVVFNNGVKREVFSNGFTIVHFTNNDKKQTLPDGTIVYYFGQAKTTQIKIQNGPQIYRFSNNQIEIHFQNGEKQIRFSDGTKKYIYPNGEEVTLFNDGLFQKVDINKIKYIEYPNGKTETTYPNGRVENQSQNKQQYY